MTKFKVGDRVEFIDESYRQSLLGKKGTVYSVSAYTPSQDLVRVKFDGESEDGGFFDHRLKKIEADIAVGDKVLIYLPGDTRHNHVGVLQSEFGSNGYIVTFGDVAGCYFDKKVIKRWLPPEASALQKAHDSSIEAWKQKAQLEIAEKARAGAQQFMYGQKVERTIAEAAHSGAPAGLVAEAARAGDKPGAEKRDDGKAPMLQGLMQRFPNALRAIALVSEYGARKYGTYNGWEKVPDARSRYGDATLRHIAADAAGTTYDDKDSGLTHGAQAAWGTLACLELALRDKNSNVKIMRGNEIKDGKPVLGTAREVK